MKTVPTTYVALVLDNSGSMQHIAKEATDTFNVMLDGLRGQERTKVAFVRFDTTAKLIVPVSDVSAVTPQSPVYCDGWTALYDGVGLAVETLQAAARRSRRAARFLLIVVTDGEENRSLKYKLSSFTRLLADCQDTGKWTVAFNVPPGSADRVARNLGLSRENVREWEATRHGVVETQSVTRRATQTYYATTAATGQSSMDNFYAPVTTDLSKVAVLAVKRKLDDISDRFVSFTVPKEVVIKDFVEAKTKRDYVVGQAFYQLMKTEKVQKSKSVLIQEKGKAAVWGGPAARELIGLPEKNDARVTPGNHSNYDIYVQSASVNRKLPRGTKVMIDTKLTKAVKPTWDHTAVATATPGISK